MVSGASGAMQVVQMGQGGQAVMLPQAAIQVATANGQIQMLPVSSLAGTGQPIVLQQSQAPQILQTPDGQTYLYSPNIQIDGTQVQQQTQPTGKLKIL